MHLQTQIVIKEVIMLFSIHILFFVDNIFRYKLKYSCSRKNLNCSQCML